MPFGSVVSGLEIRYRVVKLVKPANAPLWTVASPFM